MIKFRKAFVNITLALCVLFSSMILVSCDLFNTDPDGGSDSESAAVDTPTEEEIEDDPTTKNYDNGIFFEEEAEGYQPKIVKTETSDFIGEWEATSGNAHYLFGNLELDIKEGGIWTGNVTEEDVRGTWKESNNGLALKGEIFSCKLAFSSKNKLLLEYVPYEDSTDSVLVVMTKKD